jgi:transcription termination factor NusB
MAAAKTNGNATAKPAEDATKQVAELNDEATQKVAALAEETTKKLTELNEDATQKLAAFAEETTKQITELAEQAKATHKQQTLDAIDSYEQAVLALVESYEKAATEPKPELTNIAGVTREITTAYTAAARQLVG